MDYPLWFVDLENYEPGDKIFKMAETLLGLKEDKILRAKVNEEELFAYLIKRFTKQMFFNNRSKHYCLPYYMINGICVFSCTGCIQLKKKQIGHQQRRNYQIKTE